MNKVTNKLDLVAIPILSLSLLACGGGGGGGDEPPPPPPPATTYSVGGNLSGLEGSGLTLQNNNSNDLSLTQNGSFTFSNRINSGSSYSVTVSTQPSSPAQTCEVTNGSGTVSANVENIEVSCTTNVTVELPSSSINFDTSEVPEAGTNEELTSESELVAGDPQTVTYAYDITEPDSGAGETDIEVRMACTTKTYDIKSNPEKILLHGIDDNHRWPGALLQGGLYRDGTLRSLNLEGAHREPVTVVIKNVYNNSGKSSSRTVTNPSLSTVTDAVNELIIDGYNDDLPLGGSVSLSITETKDASRSLLKGKLSARYGTVKGSLASSVDNRQSHNSIMINLTQNLFDVVVEEPPSKEDWFTDAFFQEALADKISNGEISETNPPVYVSKVTYGRILNYTMSATASSSELRTIAKLSQDTLVAGGSLELSSNQQKVQDSINTEVAQLGGNATSAIAAAHSGDWGAYFAEDLSLTAAVPISFEFKNINDNSPAGTTEVNEVQEEICTPQIVVPGPFDFALEDIHKRPQEVGPIQQVINGDFNGDGHMDILWNHLIGDENIFYVGYGTNEGRFNIKEKACENEFCDLSDNSVAWGQFKLNKGDFNGDGMEDILWTNFDSTNQLLQLKIALANEEGFDFQVLSFEQTIDGDGMRDKIIIDDMNNDDIDDIVLWFTNLDSSMDFAIQDYQIIQSSVDSSLQPNLIFHQRAHGIETAPEGTHLDVKDINSDGWNDLLWRILGHYNDAAVSINQKEPSNEITFILNQPEFVHSSKVGWENYIPLFGDYDGDGDGDLTWIRNANGQIGAVHQAHFDQTVDNFVQNTNFQWWPFQSSDYGSIPVKNLIENNDKLFTMDVNGDGPEDVVVTKFVLEGNQANWSNRIAAMKGVFGSDPFFNTSTEPQEHPVQQDWENYSHVFIGDVNGDGLEDVVWNNAALDNSIYVAVAKSEPE